MSHKKVLSDRLTTFLAGIRGALVGHHFPGLALALLGAIKEQFNDLISFIDTFYQELTQVAKFPPKAA